MTNQLDTAQPPPVKILISGPFGVGKTTLVAAVSEIRPLRTEAEMTKVSEPVDVLTRDTAKSTTTVVMDFGRLTLPELTVYLFGTPGQSRFRYLWEEVAYGAVGAVVLADTSHLEACFDAVDFYEQRGVPFVVAINCFYGQQDHDQTEVAKALELDPDVPLVFCDARERQSVKDVLITLVKTALKQHREAPSPPAPRSPGSMVDSTSS